jgi:ABC-type lipoprotein export system ATPase subunit
MGGQSDGINSHRLSYFIGWLDTVIQICKLVDQKGALLIRVPHGSGKTSILQLVGMLTTVKRVSSSRLIISALCRLVNRPLMNFSRSDTHVLQLPSFYH